MKYDFIISISTLVHVGRDEDSRDPSKVIRAFENLLKLLSPGGKIAITLPLSYNPEIDKYLMEGRLRFDKQYYLKRISRSNKWIEITLDDVCGAKFSFAARK